MKLERDFVLLLVAQFCAQAADGIAQAGFAQVLILEPLGEAPLRVLGIFALTLLPYSLIAPFLGVFVDRWRRRDLMVWTNISRAIFIASLPLWSSWLPGDLALYGAALLILGLGRLFLTTKGASLPVVLHEHHLLRGNAISGGGGMIAALTGGILGIGIIRLMDSEASFALAGVLYVGAAIAARSLSSSMAHPHRHSERMREAVARVAGELFEGIQQVWVRERVRLSLAAIFLLRTVGIFVAIAAILVIKRDFPGAGDSGGRLNASALALGAAGVGAFVGAMSAPAIGRRLSKSGLVILGFIISATSLLVLGGLGTLPAILGLMFVGGYGAFVAKIAVDATVQEALPDAIRGRAFSLYDILYNVASVAAAATMVAFSGTSTRIVLLVAGVVTLALGALMGVAMQRAGLLSAPVPEASTPRA
jgi:MFS family permease